MSLDSKKGNFAKVSFHNFFYFLLIFFGLYSRNYEILLYLTGYLF